MKTMKMSIKIVRFIFLLIIACGCTVTENRPKVVDILGSHQLTQGEIWLSHEHILVDFIGADSINPSRWNHDTVIKEVIPYFNQLEEFNVSYFVDATPQYLGRDVLLLKKISEITGVRIITNTGLYGVDNNKYIPQYAFKMSAEELAEMWINEYEHGIDETTIKPGFIKIGVDSSDSLDIMHQKLVKAAAITHLKTGLTIASHTGIANGLWPQLSILKENGVSPQSFIWVHAQNEENNDNLLKAAEMGCWISLDGLGWELEGHIEKILFAKRNGFLDRVLISHDAGWYDPQKEIQSIKPFTDIFNKLLPELKNNGFTEEEINLLLSENPSKALSVEIRRHPL
jgi:phosphotriesterase-related protein